MSELTDVIPTNTLVDTAGKKVRWVEEFTLPEGVGLSMYVVRRDAGRAMGQG